MKEYTFKVVIREGFDEYWEDTTSNGDTGCDQVFKDIKACISDYNFQDFEVTLIKYEDK
jgi:hypothetical protein